MTKLILALAAAASLAAPAALHARPLTATDLQSLSRIGSPQVSPDGNWLVYQQREADIAANRGRLDIWLLDLRGPGARPVKIGSTAAHNESEPRFSADGRSIYFLSNASGSNQLWRVPVAGGRAVRVSNLPVDISGYLLAPSGDRIAIWAERNLACADFACTDLPAPERGGGSGRVYDGIFVRHWDAWAEPGIRSRLFTFPLAGGRVQGTGVPVTRGLVGDVPSKPFGGAEEIAWAPDGRTLYFALREAGRSEPISTNLDIFAVPADGSGPPVNLTPGNDATDTLPAISPDGRFLAYVAMRRPGYEADRQVLQIRDLATGEVRSLTEQWDRSVGSIAWAADGRSLYVTAQDVLDRPVFRVDAATGEATRLTGEGSANNVLPLRGGDLVYTLNSLQAPDDLYRHNSRTNRPVQLTRVNGARLAGIDPVSVQRFRFSGAGGDEVWGQIVRPQGATGRLPVAYLIHGGPQGSFGNGWSYRWNPWLFAAPGYAAVTVDFHGSTGYGQAFTDAINRDWGGQPLEDLRLGLAAAGRADPQIDTANACALGGSYGGYMTNWIAGNWPDGFKCLVNHAGVFDTRAMAYETEELWFMEYEFGGPPYEPEAARAIERWNPVNHVRNWRTPMLVIHGEKDFRIPYSQSLAAFNALQRREIPSRLVVYPDENHWIVKPQNSIQWYREVHAWLDQWLRRGGRQP